MADNCVALDLPHFILNIDRLTGRDFGGASKSDAGDGLIHSLRVGEAGAPVGVLPGDRVMPGTTFAWFATNVQLHSYNLPCILSTITYPQSGRPDGVIGRGQSAGLERDECAHAYTVGRRNC